MNKKRRSTLGKVYDAITEAIDSIESVKNGEQESYDNLPDSFRYGERGEEMENNIGMMDEVIGYLDDARSVIEQI